MTAVTTSTSSKIKSTDRQQQDESQSSHHSNFLVSLSQNFCLRFV